MKTRIPPGFDTGLQALAERSVRFARDGYVRPPGFLGVAGMKLLRDEVWGRLRFVFRADHRFYREHGLYDYPQRDLKMRGINLVMGILTGIRRSGRNSNSASRAKRSSRFGRCFAAKRKHRGHGAKTRETAQAVPEREGRFDRMIPLSRMLLMLAAVSLMTAAPCSRSKKTIPFPWIPA
jgi:hypothetical protein